MGRILVRANIESAGLYARLEGWVEPEVWRRACDDCSVPVHVERVLELRVRHPEPAYFDEAVTRRYYSGSLGLRDLQDMLRERWLGGEPAYVLGAELREIARRGPPPGAVPLFGESGDGA